jgi:hypothetical protein
MGGGDEDSRFAMPNSGLISRWLEFQGPDADDRNKENKEEGRDGKQTQWN